MIWETIRLLAGDMPIDVEIRLDGAAGQMIGRVQAVVQGEVGQRDRIRRAIKFERFQSPTTTGGRHTLAREVYLNPDHIVWLSPIEVQ